MRRAVSHPLLTVARPSYGVAEVTMRLLVVEDERKMARLLERGLREEGYAVDVAHDAAEALWAAGETSYDAILLDVMLPDGNGSDVCRRLREQEVWSPVLMLTARDAVGDRVAGLDAGADDYLTKPFSFEELLARLRAVARGGGERPDRPAGRWSHVGPRRGRRVARGRRDDRPHPQGVRAPRVPDAARRRGARHARA